MRTRSLALAFICLAAVGCGEDESVSGVFPSSGFLGRTMRVQISGDNTAWDSGTGVDFGPGVTVSSVSVSSPTTLFAEIVITDAAAPGLRDVIVTGGDDLALHQAFQLTSPLVVDFRGTLAQGSIVSFTAHNFDFFSPFDDTCTAASFLGCSEYGNTNVEGPPGALVIVDSVSPYMVSGTMYLGIDAGPGSFQILSGGVDETAVISPLGEQLAVAARTATPITGGLVTATVASAYDSHLYEVNYDANAVMRFSASTDGSAPTIYLLGETGTFDDFVAAGAAPSPIAQTGGKYYVIVDNASGESGFSYTLRANSTALTPLAEIAGGNNTAATAQNATTNSALLVTGGSITDDADQDWYRFTVPAGSATKKVRVITAAGDPLTDDAVEIYAFAGGTAPGTKIGGGDSGLHENITSMMPVGAATVIYVKIFTDPEYYDPAHTQYIAGIWLE